MKPRTLVVRSGANPFLSLRGSSRIEIVEKVSHSIAPVEPDLRVLETHAELAVLTSQVAVDRLFADPELANLFRKAVAGGQVAAVGSVTDEALRQKGVFPAIVANGSAESILAKLPKDLSGRSVLLPCGEDASPELPEGLRSRGARVAVLTLYRKVARPSDPELRREIVQRPFAAFCTTSPSAARWLFSELGEPAAERLRRTPAVVLGRLTRRFLESHGVQRVLVTEEAHFSAAVRLLERLAAEEGRA
ncbi:MAG TPA: uroporphyrinogen-III synthase [Thermoanaerobaculia bacterium]|nr:uroporphyrinogen-III synthase [Thermoanaerobaculia bacterium]